MLTGMGFSVAESRRALRVSGQDPERATTFALEQRAKQAAKQEEDKQRRRDRRYEERIQASKGACCSVHPVCRTSVSLLCLWNRSFTSRHGLFR